MAIVKKRILATLFIIGLLILSLFMLDMARDKNQDLNGRNSNFSGQSGPIYRPSTYSTDEWETCESSELRLSLKHPKEIECRVSLLNYSEDKSRFVLELLNPRLEDGSVVPNGGPITFFFDEYDSLDQEVTTVTMDYESSTTTVSAILESIEEKSNIKVDSRDGYYKMGNPWVNGTGMYHSVKIIDGTNILVVESNIVLGEVSNAEFEKFLKTVLSTVKFE